MTASLPLRDKLIPWYFVAFFAAIAIIDGVMVTLAVRTQTGVVTDHPYERGLAYNQVVKAVADQEALGWKGDIKYSGGVLQFVLRDRNNRLLEPQKVTAHIIRPTQAGMDFSIGLQNGGNLVKFPAKGLWEIRIDAEFNHTPYQQSKRIVVE